MALMAGTVVCPMGLRPATVMAFLGDAYVVTTLIVAVGIVVFVRRLIKEKVKSNEGHSWSGRGRVPPIGRGLIFVESVFGSRR